jgi:hypothetical protein
VPERVVIVAILVAQRQGAEPLGEQLGQPVIVLARVAPVSIGCASMLDPVPGHANTFQHER